MILEVEAKMFIESIKQPGSNELDVNGDLSKMTHSAFFTTFNTCTHVQSTSLGSFQNSFSRQE